MYNHVESTTRSASYTHPFIALPNVVNL